MPKHYTEEFKFQAVEQYKSGIPATKLCFQLGIARSTLFLWLKHYSANETSKISREQYQMQKEIECLRTENTIFKTCGCAPSSPLPVRLEVIKSHQSEFSIHALCRVLKVNRSTYYYYARRSPEQTMLEMEDNNLKPLISEIFKKSSGRFCARRIRVKLLDEGYTVSERRISRLMKELRLSSKGTKPRLNSANDRQYQYYPISSNASFSQMRRTRCGSAI